MMTQWQATIEDYLERELFDVEPRIHYCWMCGAPFKARKRMAKKRDRYGILWITFEGKFCDRACQNAYRKEAADRKRFRFL